MFQGARETSLYVGTNTITVVVTAEDGSTRSHTIEVTRKKASIPFPDDESEAS